jgi:glycerol kinase
MITSITNKVSTTLLQTLIKSGFSAQYVASIDQSTTSTKFSIFSTTGKLIDKEIIPHRQITPQDGWLEHDPL